MHNGATIKPEALHTMINQLHKRILRLIEKKEIKDKEEEQKMIQVSFQWSKSFQLVKTVHT